MQVLVTGGTGFVGSHIARTLARAGHEVRLLVRSREKAKAFFDSLGETAPQLHEGDITDVGAVNTALTDCQAAVHAAALTPLQRVDQEQLFAVNVRGTRHVVEGALAKGIERIVCLSSITAIFDPDGTKVTADAAPKPSRLPYDRSKVEAEYYLREQQAGGAPVAVLYPGAILGPHGSGLSDSCRALQHRIENGFRIFGDGGMQYIDVRDLATLACSLLERGLGGRFLVPGVYSAWTEQADMIESLTGCALSRIPARGWTLRLTGRVLDLVRRFRTVDSPISYETMCYATQWPRIANCAELEEQGMRPLRESLDDTLRWMLATGHLQPAFCPNYTDERGLSDGLSQGKEDV